MAILQAGEFTESPMATGVIIPKGEFFDNPPVNEAKAEKPSTLGQKISKGAEYLPTAGALVGGGLSMLAAPGTAGASLLGGSALAGLGAAAGKAGEQLINRAMGKETPQTATEAAKAIAKEGGYTAAINAAGGKLMQILAPTAKIAAKQILKGFARIDERLSLKVLNDPSILTRGKPLAEAQKIFGDFFDNIGFKYGPKSVKEATGKLTLSDNAADDFISDTLSKIETVGVEPAANVSRGVVQQALAARYSVGDAIKRASRAGNDTKSRLFIEGKNQIDDWLETQIPGFSNVRKIYEEAKIKKAFEPVFPLNKNKETSVLGILTSIGSAIGAGGTLGPAYALPVAMVSSPRIVGAEIKLGAKLANKATGAAAAQLAGSQIPSPEEIKTK